jgi:tetratricopeptide (TPR) repeat protein
VPALPASYHPNSFFGFCFWHIIFSIIFYFIYPQDSTTDKVIKENSQTSLQSSSNGNENINIKKLDDNSKQKNGWELYLDSRFSDSIKSLLEEKKNFPDRINIYVILGWDYGNLKRYQEMQSISLEGLKYAPSDIRIMKNLAEAYYFQNMFKEAINYFNQYIKNRFNENDPYIGYAYYYLGTCYYNLNLYRKADVALSTAKFYRPQDNKIILQLAETMEKLNDREKARKFYENVLVFEPSNVEAQEGLKRVKTSQ